MPAEFQIAPSPAATALELAKQGLRAVTITSTQIVNYKPEKLII